MKRSSLIGIVALAATITSTAAASTSAFNGTTSADTIVVGRAFWGGALSYFACVNGVWIVGGAVTGSSDAVYVYGNSGADSIKVRDVDDIYVCGGNALWFYRMDYAYSCPGSIYIHGDAGNDRIWGAQCVERIYGDADSDTIFAGTGDYVWGGTENDCIADTTPASLSCGDGTDSYTDDYAWKDCENHVPFCLLPP